MSSSGVHPDEMPSNDPLIDPALASFLDDLEVVTTRPAPAPRPGLAAFFDGISDIPLADSPAPAAPRATRRRKMTVSELLAALTAKLAGLGMAAKAGLGLGIAAASVTTAGVANVLPDPAQQAVATVVNAVAPFDVANPADDAGDVTGDVTDVIGDVTDRVPGDLVELPELPEVPALEEGEGDDTGTDGAPRNHGACVSAVARDRSATQGTPGSHGKAVSEVARSDCGKQTAGTPGTTTTTLLPTTTTTVDDGEIGASSNRGPGNGNGTAGQGGANAGRGGGNGNAGNAGRR